MTPAQIHALRTLYGQPSSVLLKQLPDVAERLHAQLLELVRCPTPERAERLATELDGVRRHVIQCRQALIREAEGSATAGITGASATAAAGHLAASGDSIVAITGVCATAAAGDLAASGSAEAILAAGGSPTK